MEAMDTVVSADAEDQIDRLSRLPPELLDKIFDHAYTPDKPPRGPLSKALLPWFTTGLYRRIKLERSEKSKFLKLVSKISSEPSLGRQIEQLHIECYGSDRRGISISRDELGRFFSSLVRLKKLDLGRIDGEVFEYLRDNPSAISSATFPSLGSLRIPNSFDLSGLTSFSALRSLHVGATWSDWRPIEVFSRLPASTLVLSRLPALPHLVHLSIASPAVDGDQTAPSLTSLYPQLSHVRLVSYSETLQQALPLLPPDLQQLELIRCEVGDQSYHTCDHLLRRFTRLENLSMGSFIFSPNLPTHISHLTSLQVLKVGHGAVSVDQFLRLVTGPTRLPSLVELDLDLLDVGNDYGDRCEVSRGTSPEWTMCEGSDPPGGEVEPSGWGVPEFDESIGFTFEKIKDFIRVVKEEGMELGLGGGFTDYEEYLLVVANLAIYRCYRDKTLQHLHHLRTEYPDLCGQLPILELDRLDPKNLGIVKTERPEFDWYALTLTDREDAEELFKNRVEEYKQLYGEDWMNHRLL
ncbi:hypothetical protein JCM3765_004759 [Sporobolomyces pararoseus]